jgi:hypothetical protein
MIRRGDNFKMAGPAITASVLAQFVEFEAANPRCVRPTGHTFIKSPAPHRVPERIEKVIAATLAKHGVSREAWLGKTNALHVVACRQEVYANIRDLTTWQGKPPTPSAIARWCRRHQSSVRSGLMTWDYLLAEQSRVRS